MSARTRTTSVVGTLRSKRFVALSLNRLRIQCPRLLHNESAGVGVRLQQGCVAMSKACKGDHILAVAGGFEILQPVESEGPVVVTF